MNTEFVFMFSQLLNHFAMNFFIIPSLCTFIFFEPFLEEKLISKSICTIESLFMSIIYYLPPEVYESVFLLDWGLVSTWISCYL